MTSNDDLDIPSALIVPFQATDCHFILQAVIRAIHVAIQKLPNDIDFSSPTLFANLPFPSTFVIPAQRFELRKQDNLYHFRYMGRSKFNDLLERVQGDTFVAGFESIYLYGSSGSGKSHLLAALVCYLIREKKRVLYVPNCVELLKNFEKVIRTGLSFACYESEPLFKEIQSARSFDDLYRIWDEQTDIYFIVDQLNALELDPKNPSLDAKKSEVTIRLHQMSSGHRYIFSASANEQSNLLAEMKQNGTYVIRFNGGMSQVCLCFNGHV
jgi:energy-coupling factor transporter ATP-binding protein EcfA2